MSGVFGNSLPDEIVSEILTPALKVPDEKFSNTHEISPFTEYSEPPSAYLLVCKSWLRVATPLLYNVVVIRSKAQAKALAHALSKNKDLGQFIKHLRVEGGYGAPMRTVLKSAPNITDLCVSFEIHSSDNTSGLCDGLHSIQPSRLIIRDHWRPSHNKMVAQLEDALATVIPAWQRLAVFQVSDANFLQVRSKVTQALLTARKLQAVVINSIDDAIVAYDLFKSCPLQSIQVVDMYHPMLARHDLHWANQSFRDLVKFRFPIKDTQLGTDSTSVLRSSSLSFSQFSVTPMKFEPQEIQDKIWGRILYFALAVPLSDGYNAISIPSRLPFLLISKKLHQLALPHYYTHLSLAYPNSAAKIAAILDKNPSLGPHVRTIGGANTFSDSYDSDSDSDDGSVSIHDWPLSILLQTTGVIALYGPYSDHSDSEVRSYERPISWDAFKAVVRSSGSTLQELAIPIEPHERASPLVFAPLEKLRSLTWMCDTSFACSPESLPSQGLRNLRYLRIYSAHQSFMDALSLMELPSLQRLFITDECCSEPWDFLRNHGSKLTELEVSYSSLKDCELAILDVCPTIRTMSLFLDRPAVDPPEVKHLLRQKNSADLLEKIVFGSYAGSDSTDQKKWTSFIGALKPIRFPQLREVQFTSFRWPKKERDISKSIWVRWSEILLKQGINLIDETGKKWRTRLK